MKKQLFVLAILTAGVITALSFTGKAGGGSDMGSMPCCSATSGPAADQAQTTAVTEKLAAPVAAVFDSYSLIQTELAQDSIKDVTKEAQAIAKAVSGDAMTTFSTNVEQQAKILAKATDLRGAREAFKPLSKSLIEYVSKHPALAASYRQVHCSMANADWMQKESTVNNPYLGKEMPHCGEFIKGSSDEEQGDSMPGMHM